MRYGIRCIETESPICSRLKGQQEALSAGAFLNDDILPSPISDAVVFVHVDDVQVLEDHWNAAWLRSDVVLADLLFLMANEALNDGVDVGRVERVRAASFAAIRFELQGVKDEVQLRGVLYKNGHLLSAAFRVLLVDRAVHLFVLVLPPRLRSLLRDEKNMHGRA